MSAKKQISVSVGDSSVVLELSDDEIARIEREARNHIKLAKADLILRMPFWGILASQLKVVLVRHDHPFVRTAAVDGKHIYFNPLFITLLNQKSRLFVWLHELSHIMLESAGRRGNRDPKLWNYATDYAINCMLVAAGIELPTEAEIVSALAKMGAPNASLGNFPAPDRVIVLYDTKFSGMTAEAIYEVLKSELDENTLELESMGTLDQHGMPGGGEDGKSGDRDVDSILAGMTDAEKSAWKARINQAAMSAKAAGGMPAGISVIIDMINRPKVDWRNVLATKMTTCKTSDYEWTPPDQDYFWRGITLPQIHDDYALKVAIVMDSSGSMGPDDRAIVMGEMVGIASQFSSYEMLIMTFDGDVHNPVIYNEEDGNPAHTYDFMGGGGTLFSAPFEYLAGDRAVAGENCQFVPDCVVFMTDGYPCDGWQDKYSEMFDVVWLITTPNANIVAPWGLTVEYDKYI